MRKTRQGAVTDPDSGASGAEATGADGSIGTRPRAVGRDHDQDHDAGWRAGASGLDGGGKDRAAEDRAGSHAESLAALDLAEAIEAQIIPRLLLMHRSRYAGSNTLSERAGLRDGTAASMATEAERLAAIARHGHVEDGVGLVLEALNDGFTMDAVLLELFPAAARVIGGWWEADSCDFVTVTIATGRLQQVLREVMAVEALQAPPGPVEGSILLASVPGEMHVFALSLLEAVFRRARWLTTVLMGPEAPDIIRTVRAEHYDVAALSATSVHHLEGVPALIADIRAQSRNPSVLVMVGGPPFYADRGLAAAVGADAVARDPASAIAVARRLTDGRRGAVADMPLASRKKLGTTLESRDSGHAGTR